jgi:hypothetical protein
MLETDSQPKKSPTLTFLGGIVGFLLFTGITAYVYTKVAEKKHAAPYEAARAEVRVQTLKEVRDSDGAIRSSYGWLDKQKGVVRLPVQRSMEVVLPELQASKPRASGVKVPPPAVPAPAAPAPAEADTGKIDPSAPKAPAAAPSPTPTPAPANPAPAATTIEPGSLFPPPEAAPSPSTTKPEAVPQ